jgi:hypothetical protein
MLYLDSSPPRFDVSNKKIKIEGMIHSLLQRRRKESNKLSYMKDFEANVKISEEIILCSQNVQGRSIKSHMLPSYRYL